MKRIALATGLAFLAASAVFVTLVLPAEFGVDPTGVGRALNLTGLAGEQVVNARRTETPLAMDERSLALEPFESVELKYDLAAGDGLVYAWTAEAEVFFDLHAEPADAPPGVAESFLQGRRRADAGTYTAAFDGRHGWFWENRGPTPLTVRLRVAGFATGATHYHDGRAERLPWP